MSKNENAAYLEEFSRNNADKEVYKISIHMKKIPRDIPNKQPNCI